MPGAQPSTGASTKFSCCSILLTIFNSRVITLILNFKFIRLRMSGGFGPPLLMIEAWSYGGIGMKKIYDSLLFSFLLLQNISFVLDNFKF